MLFHQDLKVYRFKAHFHLLIHLRFKLHFLKRILHQQLDFWHLSLFQGQKTIIQHLTNLLMLHRQCYFQRQTKPLQVLRSNLVSQIIKYSRFNCLVRFIMDLNLKMSYYYLAKIMILKDFAITKVRLIKLGLVFLSHQILFKLF